MRCSCSSPRGGSISACLITRGQHICLSCICDGRYRVKYISALCDKLDAKLTGNCHTVHVSIVS